MNLAKIDLIQNIFYAAGLVCMPSFITTAALNQENWVWAEEGRGKDLSH